MLGAVCGDWGCGECGVLPAWRSQDHWHLKLDDQEVNETIKIGPDHSNNGPSDSTNVRLNDMPAFLGGRPGATNTHILTALFFSSFNIKPNTQV